MTRILAVLALIGLPGLAAAEVVTQTSERSVAETVEKLTTTIEGVGATVFAVVDHGGGAQSIGADIGASQLVIFGNPQIGTPAIADDRLAGLYLPLKVLVFEDAGGTVTLAYEDPAAMLGALDGIDGGAEYLQKMTMALNNFVTNAAR